MTSQTKDRKSYESPLSELIYILPEGVICNGSGTGGEGMSTGDVVDP